MSVLVCAATPTEAKACLRGIQDAGCDHEVLLTGVGFHNAGRALLARLKRGPKPELVVSSGFAGALSPSIELWSWIVAKQVLRGGNGDAVAVNLSKLRVAHETALSCNLVSASELTLQSSGSAKAYEKIAAPLAVDMESAALAEVAESHGLAFMVLRLITDTPQKPLPDFVSAFAAAMAAPDLKSRAQLGLRGIGGATKDMAGALRLVREGRNWAQLLRSGWREHATKL